MPKGIFGQTTFDPATGSQREMFDTSRPKLVSEPIKGSKNALNPKHTGQLFHKGTKMPTAEGHWITLEGRHILIRDPIGGGKGFSRAEIHRKLIAHHESVQGKGSYTAQDEKDLQAAAGAGDPFTFHKQLPTEIKQFQQGRPELRSLFKVTQNVAEAGGADAFGELGDKYLHIAEAKAGSPLKAALNTARTSNDPEVRFMAAIHDHLPPESKEGLISQAGKAEKRGDTATAQHLRAKAAELPEQSSLNVSKLRVGQSFKIQGDEFHVVEDSDGFKVLSGPSDYPEVPLEALKKIPVDRGSFRAAKGTKMKNDNIAPFSTVTPAYYLHAAADLTDAVTLGQGLPSEILGQPVKYFWADGISCGKYIHPTKKFTLDVERRHLDEWEAAHKKMKDAGVDVPAVADHSEKARDSLGNVLEIKRVGDKLRVLHQLIGEDAIRMAARNKVSLGISPSFTDGKGVCYGSAVVHSSLTPVPVVPGQAGFVAASRGQTTDQFTVDVLCLATVSPKGEQPMKAETLQKIRELPGAAEVPEDGAVEFLLSYATTAAENVETLKGKLETAETQVQTMSRESDKEMPTARELYLSAKDVARERQEIIASGALMPTIADKAERTYLGKSLDPTTLTLSRKVEDGDDRILTGFDRLREFYDLVRGNKPTTYGEKTGRQHAVAMSRAPEDKLPREGDHTQDATEAEAEGIKQGAAWREEQLRNRGLAKV